MLLINELLYNKYWYSFEFRVHNYAGPLKVLHNYDLEKVYNIINRKSMTSLPNKFMSIVLIDSDVYYVFCTTLGIEVFKRNKDLIEAVLYIEYLNFIFNTNAIETLRDLSMTPYNALLKINIVKEKRNKNNNFLKTLLDFNKEIYNSNQYSIEEHETSKFIYKYETNLSSLIEEFTDENE